MHKSPMTHQQRTVHQLACHTYVALWQPIWFPEDIYTSNALGSAASASFGYAIHSAGSPFEGSASIL